MFLNSSTPQLYIYIITTINVFIHSNFEYCPWVWGFSSRKSIGKIDYLHQMTVKIFTDQGSFSLVESVQQRHCKLLLKEVFKTKHGLNPSF